MTAPGTGGPPGPRRRAVRIGAIVVLLAIATSIVAGWLDGGGLSSAWLWIGLALVPVLLWLVRVAGWDR